MLGVSDLTLPTRRLGRAREMVFGLARTDQCGAQVIEDRVRAEIGRHPRLTTSGFQTHVSSHCFELGRATGSEVELALNRTSYDLETQLHKLEEGED